MIKDCTSVEQGRMLVALGISPSTADKCWISIELSKDEPALYSLSWEQARENRMTADRFLTDIAKKSKPDALTPAWSLTALLDLLPSEIKDGGRVYSFRMNKIGDEYQICYSDEDSHDLYSILEDTPVNAAFKMLYLLNDIKEYN